MLNKDRVPLLPYWLPQLDVLEQKEKDMRINEMLKKQLNEEASQDSPAKQKKKIEYCEPSLNEITKK